MPDGLTSEEIDRLTAVMTKLQAELRSLESDTAQWREPVELDQQSVGRLSRMDAMQQQAMSEAEGRRRQVDLQRIEAALERVEAQEYGWCAECGEAIAIRRLEIDPMATHCVSCAK